MYRALDKWFMPWLKSRRRLPSGQKHLLFCVADHFEPFRKEEGDGRPKAKNACADVETWLQQYDESLGDFRDADGKAPRHTFFYPAEDYDEGCLQTLADFCGSGLGEVEIQLHHRHDSPQGFKKKIATFKEQLRRLGLLGTDSAGKRRFGFVHGNWSLCNSRSDGDWCGVNEELGLLRELGCYADFTFPSAPSETQPRMANCVYRAIDTPGRARGHEAGVPAGVGVPEEQGLMLITGPLGLRWAGLRPRLENSAITSANPPGEARVRYWANRGIGIIGRSNWVFVKVHMHGMTELNTGLFVEDLPKMHHFLHKSFNDGEKWVLHYVSAREMYNIARAAECGRDGDPSQWRDFEIRCNAGA